MLYMINRRDQTKISGLTEIYEPGRKDRERKSEKEGQWRRERE